MNKKLLFVSYLGAVTVAIAGCAPQLARTKYGSEERQWKSYINKSYKDWNPPPTPPPYKTGADLNSYKNLSNIEIIPKPSNSPENINIVDTAPKAIGTDNKKVKTYIVKKGDTLWSISYKFYNNGKNWKKIREFNKAQLPNPNSLKPGISLTIPAE